MSKVQSIVIALALAVVPVGASAQQIGVSVRIAPAPEQPRIVVAEAAQQHQVAGMSVEAPRGWLWSVTGDGVAQRSSRAGVQANRSVQLAQTHEPADGTRTVTWTFVPL